MLRRSWRIKSGNEKPLVTNSQASESRAVRRENSIIYGICLRPSLYDRIRPTKQVINKTGTLFGRQTMLQMSKQINDYHFLPLSLKSFPCLSFSTLASNSFCASALANCLSSSTVEKVKLSPDVDPSLCSLSAPRRSDAKRLPAGCDDCDLPSTACRLNRSHADPPLRLGSDAGFVVGDASPCSPPKLRGWEVTLSTPNEDSLLSVESHLEYGFCLLS